MTIADVPAPYVKLSHLRAGAAALVCIPYAGGGTTVFRSWPASLPGVDLYALDLPGREARLADAPFTSLEPLVASAVAALQPLKRSFALFGHSMGALIAFETARLLHRRDLAAPLHLFVSGFRAPHLPDRKPPVHDLPHLRFIEELRRIGAPTFDPAAHPELTELMLPTLRADFRLVQSYAYRPGPPLACPVTAFGGAQDADVDEAQLREWRRHTSGRFALSLLPGGHFFLRTEPEALLRELHRHLESA